MFTFKSVFIALLLLCSWTFASVLRDDTRPDEGKEAPGSWTAKEKGIKKHECEMDPFCSVTFKELFEEYLKTYLDVPPFYSSLYLSDKTLLDGLLEAFRVAVHAESGSLVLYLEVALRNQVFSLEIRELWVILENLMKDSTEPSLVITEFIALAVALTEKAGSMETDPDIYDLVLEVLGMAINSEYPAVTIGSLFRISKNHLTKEHFQSILVLLIETVNSERDQIVPAGFSSFIAAVEELGPVKCFQYIFGTLLTDGLPVWAMLSPFYLLFKHVDNISNVEPLKEYLKTCVFEFHTEDSLVISEFVRMTDFNSLYSWYDSEAEGRRFAIFVFFLGRFEIVPNICMGFFLDVIVTSNSVALAETCMQHLLIGADNFSRAMQICLARSFSELAVVVAIRGNMDSEEVREIYDRSDSNTRRSTSISMMRSIRGLLDILADFDNDEVFHEVLKQAGDETFVEHPFPEPEEYEKRASILAPFNPKRLPLFDHAIDAGWVARIFLKCYFGFSFLSTRIDGDSDSVPIWREILGKINFFLDQACKDLKVKHKVVYEKPTRKLFH